MTWQAIFQVTNAIAMIGWLLLALAPRRPFVMSLVLYAGVALLCLIYAAMLVALSGGLVDAGRGGPEPGFAYSVSGIRALLASDGGITIAWTHFLAQDLFVGLWIARDADNKDYGRGVQIPFLFVTLIAGPMGLLAWLVFREKRSRAATRANR